MTTAARGTAGGAKLDKRHCAASRDGLTGADGTEAGLQDTLTWSAIIGCFRASRASPSSEQGPRKRLRIAQSVPGDLAGESVGTRHRCALLHH